MRYHFFFRFLFFGTILVCSGRLSKAQTTADYVPCPEMPELIQQFKADRDALERYYTPAGKGQYYNDDKGASSPEKRERMEKLYQEYLQKLSALDFQKLSQECKTDYI